MLTLPEKFLFLAAVILSLYGAFLVAQRISGAIQRGEGRLDWSLAKNRLGSVLVKTITLRPVFRLRLWPSLFHGFIAGCLRHDVQRFEDRNTTAQHGAHGAGKLGDSHFA